MAKLKTRPVKKAIKPAKPSTRAKAGKAKAAVRKPAAAKKAPVKKAPAKKTVAKGKPMKRKGAATGKAGGKRPATPMPAATKALVKKKAAKASPAKRTAKGRTPARPAEARKDNRKKTAVRKAAVKKAPARKATVKAAPKKQAAPKKTAAPKKKAAPKNPAKPAGKTGKAVNKPAVSPGKENKAGTVKPPVPTPRPAPARPEAEHAARPARAALKQRYQLEFYLNVTPALLFELISTPSGFSEWFCDDVNVADTMYTFKWGEDTGTAECLVQRPGELVRFRWDEDAKADPGAYFELRIRVDGMTNETCLIVTDHAWPKDLEEEKALWESQIHTLIRVLGA